MRFCQWIAIPVLLLAAGAEAGWLPEERLTERPDVSDRVTGNNARAVAGDRDGNIHVVWYGGDGGIYQVWYSCRNAVSQEWTPNTMVSAEVDGAWYPCIAADDSGNVHVVWQAGELIGNGQALRYRCRDWHSGTWGEVETVCTGTHVERPSVACLNSDFVVAVWEEQPPESPKNIFVSIREAGGWSIPETVSVPGTYSNHKASVGVDSTDRIGVLWRYHYQDGRILFRLRSGTGWSEIDTIQQGYQCDAPCLRMEPNGVAHAVWTADAQGGGGRYLFYRQRRDDLWADSVPLPRPSTREPGPASVGFDGSGHLHVVWCVDTAVAGTEVYYTTADSSGTQWTRPFRLTNAAGNRVNPTLSCGPGTNIQLVWTDYRNSSTYCPDVYCRRSGVIHDLAATEILSPPQYVDSGQVFTPAGVFENRGEVPETFTAWFSIDSLLMSRAVAELMPGESDSVEFDDWVAVSRDWCPMSCSTWVSGDTCRGNDIIRDSVFVCVRDMAVDRIVAPVDSMPVDTVIPKAAICNRGNVSVEFNCYYRITSDSLGVVYADTDSVQLGPDSSLVVEFESWLGEPGEYTARCSTGLAGDMRPENDTCSTRFELYWSDVGIDSVWWPADTVDSGTVVAPGIQVHNYGSRPTDFQAFFSVGSRHSESRLVMGLPPGTDTTLQFSGWQASARNWFPLRCSLHMDDDMNPSNDVVRDSCFVRVIDVAAESIISPAGSAADTVWPRASVHNHGNTPVEFDCRFWIESESPAVVYADTVPVQLEPDSSQVIEFESWVSEPGEYTAQCSTGLAGDMVGANDACSSRFNVLQPDVAITEVLWPPPVVDSGTIEPPRIRVSNFGETFAGFRSWFAIGGHYADTAFVESLPPCRDTMLEFADWHAVLRGSHAVRCSLFDITDGMAVSCFPAGSVFVRVVDVSADSILAPVGSMPADTVIPKAAIRNRGNVSVEFDCYYRIISDSLVYADTVSVQLGSDSSLVVEFESWVSEPGEYTAQCSTGLAGDMVGANDACSSRFNVLQPDVAITEVLWPPPVVDSGTIEPPRIRVSNFGETFAGFRSWFAIGGHYADTAFVESLPPCRDTMLEFADWHAVLRGSHAVRCSLFDITDGMAVSCFPAGSVFVRVVDVSADSILAPVGSMPADTVIPKAAIRNRGNVSVEFDCYYRIISDSLVYADTVSVQLGSDSSLVVEFESWFGEPGDYTARCSTGLAGDMRPTNDTCSTRFELYWSDIGVLRIEQPRGVVDSGAVITPAAWVGNHGDSVETDVLVWFRIGSVVNVDTVAEIAPGDSARLEFDLWLAEERGRHEVVCSTAVAGDMDPGNDVTRDSCFVRVTDAGVTEIVHPTGTIGPGPVEPKVRFANFGNETVPVTCRLAISGDSGVVYADSVRVEMGPESDSIAEFGIWEASVDSYCVSSWTELDGDMLPGNDTVEATLVVVLVDAGVVEIIEPAGVIQEGPVAPRVRVINLGGRPADISVSFAIADTGPVFVDTVELVAVPASSETVAIFDDWDARPGIYSMFARVVLAGDPNPENDTVSGEVRVDSIVSWRWLELADVPAGSRRAPVRNGGSLVAVADGVLALKGCNTSEWYRYDVAGDSWIALEPVPRGAGGRRVRAGAALCWDVGDYVFALKGNRTREFWRYDIAQDRWDSLSGLPAGTRPVKYGAGLAFVAGDTSRVFTVKGSRTFDFLVYWVEPGQWHARRPVPAGQSGKKPGRGTCLASLNGRVFCLKGGTNEFYEYFAGRDSWTPRAELPKFSSTGRKRRCKKGAALTGDPGQSVHAFKGGACNEFWMYDAAADTWVQAEDVPKGNRSRKVKRGAALAWFDGRVYALKGGGCREFWRFDPQAVLVPRPFRKGVETERSVSLPGVSAVQVFTVPGSGCVTVTGLSGMGNRVQVFDVSGRRVPFTIARPGRGIVLSGFERAGVYFLAAGPEQVPIKFTVFR